jgi:hypothetical protein
MVDPGDEGRSIGEPRKGHAAAEAHVENAVLWGHLEQLDGLLVDAGVRQVH